MIVVKKDVSQKIKRMQTDFSNAFNRMNETNATLKNPNLQGDFNVSVMTILLEFDVEFESWMQTDVSWPANFNVQHMNSGTISARRNFRNQVSVKIKHEDGSKKCCKFFRNGKVHVTGTKSLAEALYTVEGIMGHMYGSALEFYVELVSFEIEMLNTGLRMNCSLLLSQLSELCISKRYQTVYDPTRYPGCKVYIGNCTVLVFSSGCMILTGCNSCDQMEHAYSTLLNLLDTHSDDLVMEAKDGANSKRKRVKRIHGYPAALVHCTQGVEIITL